MDLNILNKTPNLKFNKGKGNFTEHDIAIIGLNAQIGHAEDIEAFWKALCDGQDFIRDFPEHRLSDANEIYTLLNGESLPDNIIQCAYMDRIDLFDASLFHISATEANYMSPMQRVFLESAWLSIEDGGYGGGKIENSATGIYLGYSASENPFGEALAKSDPEAGGIVVSGNVNSIIASRISYLLNLTGPALLIDTACSSSLVALHIACNQIRSKEVEMAIVGGIRLMVLPRMEQHNLLGVESSSSHTRTFDSTADGTGGGEGVICMLLKSALEAEHDGDHIYAIIKGSSINQDGTSMGLTAPSADAQDAVIRTAWENAKVTPSEISYIEAHGTATKLGDPIEINGIEKAFRHYTHRNQSCGIGSVKTNIGHLDAAAGLVGLLKTILMLNHKMILPSIGFNVPNSEINFISSPVYIADKLAPWESERSLRLCGVSSFGISGTNCHVILEEAPKLNKDDIQFVTESYLLTISAETIELLKDRIIEYKGWLFKNPETSFDDFCYSANYGRHVFNCRFYAYVSSKHEFLNTDYDLTRTNVNYAYNEFKLTNVVNGVNGGLLSYSEQSDLSNQVVKLLSDSVCMKGTIEYTNLLKKIGQFFIKGAVIPWKTLYRGENRRTLQIPVHKLNHHRFWPKILTSANALHKPKRYLHPLINELVEDSYHIRTYRTIISTENCWELREHKINDVHVLVGTAFIEMAHFIASDYLKSNNYVFQNLVFYQALTCVPNEIIEIHSIAKQDGDILKIGFHSQHRNKWETYMEVEVKKRAKFSQEHENIENIMDRCSKININNMPLESFDHIVQIESNRWSNIECVWKGNDELLIKFNVSELLKEEKSKYYLYPSLLDPAINSGNMLINSIFLPYSCKSAEFLEQLPNEFYSNIRRNASQSSEEFSIFEITFYSMSGKVIGKLNDYVIKRVNRLNLFLGKNSSKEKVFHKIEWKKQELRKSKIEFESEIKTLVLCREDQLRDISLYIDKSVKVEVVVVGLDMEETSCDAIFLRNCQSDYDALINKYNIFDYNRIVYTTILGKDDFIKPNTVDILINITMKSLFYMVKALLKARVRNQLEFVLLTEFYDKVVQSDIFINPFSRAFAGLGVCVQHEYNNFNVRIIDIDKEVDKSLIVDEIKYASEHKIIALRQDERYCEVLMECDDEPKTEINLRDSGIYIIAGGLGGMGLAFCERLLANNKRIRVILLNRSYAEEDLKNVMEADGTTIGKIAAKIKRLWNEGFDIHVEQCDISNYVELSFVIRNIKERYGRIDGIINAAGIAGDGFIINKTWEEFRNVLAPKIYGTLNLHLLTENDELQFFVMCSSMTSIFGALGQSDYTAANAFLDGFAGYKCLSGANALSINWTGWSESGMAVNYGVAQEEKYVYFLKDEEGAEVMYNALQLDVPRVLAGRFNYVNLEKQIKDSKGIIMLSEEMKNYMAEIITSDNINESEEINISDLIITGKRFNMLTTVEIHVILAWVKTLQVKEVDINDKFFEVGGNSLLIAYLHKELEKYYPGVTSITDLFLYSSILEIADFIQSKQSLTTTLEDGNASQNIDDLLEKLINGELDIDDVDHMIKL